MISHVEQAIAASKPVGEVKFMENTAIGLWDPKNFQG